MTEAAFTQVEKDEPIWWHDLRFEPTAPRCDELKRYVLNDPGDLYTERGAYLSLHRSGQWICHFPSGTYRIGHSAPEAIQQAVWSAIGMLRYRLQLLETYAEPGES